MSFHGDEELTGKSGNDKSQSRFDLLLILIDDTALRGSACRVAYDLEVIAYIVGLAEVDIGLVRRSTSMIARQSRQSLERAKGLFVEVRRDEQQSVDPLLLVDLLLAR